jgi:replicative superfamily II helicase
MSKERGCLPSWNDPEMAKSEIEDMYRQGIIKDLVCTSTLLEGVNLPADRLFIYKPYKNNVTTPLNDFDFGNLIGRVGRVFAGLHGSIYCIQLENERWAEPKLASSPEKEIVPITNQATTGKYKEQLISILAKPATEMTGVSLAVVSTIVFLRQKAIRDPDNLINYLKGKDLSAEEATTFPTSS